MLGIWTDDLESSTSGGTCYAERTPQWGRAVDNVRAGVVALSLAAFTPLLQVAAVAGQSDPDPSAMLLTIPSDSVSFMIGGIVVSAETGDPIAGAQVFLAATRIGTLTDRSGRLRLDAPMAGPVELTVRLIGYGEVCYNVELLEGAMQSIGIRLRFRRRPQNQLDEPDCADPETDPRSPR